MPVASALCSVGRISEAFMGLWRRNQATGLATKVGHRRVRLLTILKDNYYIVERLRYVRPKVSA